jgi:predicted O-methyltransferase YrrM
MVADTNIPLPALYESIKAESQRLHFNMLSDIPTGSLLKTLVASKPGGAFLEIGTGTGLSLAWIVAGADARSFIVSIDNEASFQAVARNAFSQDSRITFECTNGADWLQANTGKQFDLIFADAWPGKFENLDAALEIVKVGGFYVIDDLLPQPNWPEGHAAKVEKLLGNLTQRPNFTWTSLHWSTGVLVGTKIRQ